MTNLFDFKQYNHHPFLNDTILYQGAPGAYTHIACLKYFGENCRCQNVEHLQQVFEMLDKGLGDYGIVPIENSTAGAVNNVLDYLLKYHCYINAQLTLPIAHCLMGIKGSCKENLTDVYSHIQSLNQCEQYIHHHTFNTHALENNAFAAKYVANSNDLNKGAIGSELCASIYGLEILDHCINDLKDNYTRFAIISKHAMMDSDCNKTTLTFTVDNKAGALLSVLQLFNQFNINLTRIESRPIHDKPWAYRFFIDFSGSIKDKDVLDTLNQLLLIDPNMTILGCYQNN